MKIGLDIDADVLKSFLKRYPQAMAESTSIFIDRVGYKLQNASVKAAPAITGNLRRSIFYFGREAASYMSGNIEGQLRVNAKYGAVVHGVSERFLGETVDDIIASLVASYAPTYTTTNVNAPQVVERISFNRLPLSQCLDKLAKLNNSNWYIDYYKDIHFFARSEELAPFNLTDDSDNYILSSLRIRSDLSQLRNLVLVQGGDVPVAPRTTLDAGDGERTEFATKFKFANMPTVTVDGVPVTVGIEYLDTTGFDAYWSFQEKYIRFDAGSIPPAPTLPDTTNIAMTGQPLAPLVATIPDAASIAEYGEYEFAVVEKTLQSETAAIERGIAELESYAAEITDATFETYTPGLRSGQLLNISSDLHGVSADYVIQSVSFRPYPNGAALDGVWSVSLASTASMTLVDALRKLLTDEQLEADELEVLLSFYRFDDRATGTDEVDTPETTIRPYYLADGVGVVGVGKTPFICNFAVLEV